MAGLFEIITIGLSIIASVTTLLREQSSRDRDNELATALRRVESRIAVLEQELAKPYDSRNDESYLAAYNALLEVLRESRHYSSYLQFIPTDYGTWKLVRKKTTILRDPEGEYYSIPEQLLNIDTDHVNRQ